MNKNAVELALEQKFGPPAFPTCKADARRPKCLFEDNACPRHEILDVWHALNGSARAYALLQEREGA